MDFNLLPWLKISLAILLVGIIYVTWAKIPSKSKQWKDGERIISKRVTQNYAEVRKEFQDYFGRIFRLLVFMSLAFFAVNVLIMFVINIFLESQGFEFGFFGDLPLPQLSRWAVSVIVSFMMCSAGWLTITSLFYHNRAVKLILKTKYYDFFG